MAALSFQLRFVDRIRCGLKQPGYERFGPKTQTIRALRKDGRPHAAPGQTLNLYYHQRFKDGFMIGNARCTLIVPITIKIAPLNNPKSLESIDSEVTGLLSERSSLDLFAYMDGFTSWTDMRVFWHEHHPEVTEFEGSLIRWEPLT